MLTTPHYLRGLRFHHKALRRAIAQMRPHERTLPGILAEYRRRAHEARLELDAEPTLDCMHPGEQCALADDLCAWLQSV